MNWTVHQIQVTWVLLSSTSRCLSVVIYNLAMTSIWLTQTQQVEQQLKLVVTEGLHFLNEHEPNFALFVMILNNRFSYCWQRRTGRPRMTSFIARREIDWQNLIREVWITFLPLTTHNHSGVWTVVCGWLRSCGLSVISEHWVTSSCEL